MNPFLEHRRRYDDAIKYRCVEKSTLFPDTIRDDVRSRYFDAAGISPTAFARYWSSSVGQRQAGNGDAQAIAENFRYMFTKARKPYRTGRFNTGDFPALYTAKEQETAKKERFHYVAGATKRFEFAVYSVKISGEIADLRPLATTRLPIDDDHNPCRLVATQVRHDVDGVAWFSLRNIGGACCAFFRCTGVTAGSVEETGTVSPA